MKFVLIFYLIAIAYSNAEDCLEPKISLNYVQSTEESIFLRWQTDKFCSYEYNVTWYDTDEGDSGERNLEKDNSMLNVTGLKSNKEYVFSITTDNSSKAEDFTIYTAPGKVENLTVINATYNSITLSWHPPVEGSGNSTWSKVCEISLKQCYTVSVTEYKFTALTPCKNHTFSVTSVGYESYNSSTPLTSSASVIKHETLNAVPGKVVDLTVISTSSSSIQATWSFPSLLDNPYCVLKYNVSVTGDNYSNYTWTSAQWPSLDINNLQSCTEYNVSVASIGEEGMSSPVNYRPVKTAPAPVPENNIKVSKSLSSVGIKWTPADHGSDCLTEYLIYEVLDNSISKKKSLKNVSSTDELEYTLTGLEPCDSKTIQIYTMNEEGALSDGTKKILYTDGDNPGVIINLKVVSTYYHTKFSWTVPATSSKCGQSVLVCAEAEGNVEAKICKTIARTNTYYDFYNLRSCKKYVFSITWTFPGVKFNEWSTTAVTDYQSSIILQKVGATTVDDNTLVKWYVTDDNTNGRDCIQYFSVCWTKDIFDDSTCSKAKNTASSASIPEQLADIYEIHVKAVFNDGISSNELIYYGGSVILQTSPVFIACGVFIHFFLTRN